MKPINSEGARKDKQHRQGCQTICLSSIMKYPIHDEIYTRCGYAPKSTSLMSTVFKIRASLRFLTSTRRLLQNAAAHLELGISGAVGYAGNGMGIYILQWCLTCYYHRQELTKGMQELAQDSI